MGIDSIVEYIFNPSINDHSPCSLLVLGTSHGIDVFCEEVLIRYRQHHYKHIIISGYKGEAQTIAHNLESLGIPKSKMILEHQARNTLENFLLSKPLIKQANIQHLHILGKLYALPRIKLTAYKHLTETKLSFISVDFHEVSAKNWYNNPAFVEKLRNEFVKIKKYAAQGDILGYDRYFSDQTYEDFMNFMEKQLQAR